MDYTWTFITSDQVICKSPCLLKSVIISPSGSSVKPDCTLYNGESTDDPKVLILYAVTGATMQLQFEEPLKLDRGLYIDVGSNVGGITVQWSTSK